LQADRLDLVYLRRWSVSLGVVDLLHRALEEAGLSGGEADNMTP